MATAGEGRAAAASRTASFKGVGADGAPSAKVTSPRWRPTSIWYCGRIRAVTRKFMKKEIATPKIEPTRNQFVRSRPMRLWLTGRETASTEEEGTGLIMTFGFARGF